MSDFYTSITAQTLGQNRTLVVIDDTGYVSDDDINKVLVRSQLGHPADFDEYNTNAIDGHGIITSITSQDPTTLVTTGLPTTVSGYDGVVVSSDGSRVYRGEVKSYTNTPDVLEGGTFVSYKDQSWILGGYYTVEGAYSTDIWYSENGKSYRVIAKMPTYFTGRKWASAVIDSSLNIYLVSGTQSDDSTARTDILKGSFVADNPTITWTASAWFSGLGEYTKAAIDTTEERIYISEGYIDYSTTPSINAGLGTFEAANHDQYTYFLWEDYYNTLVFSDATYRHKWSLNEARDTVIDDTSSAGTVFTYRKSVAATNWSITHNIGNSNYTMAVFDDDGIPVDHYSVSKGTNTLGITFLRATAGVCFVLSGATQKTSATQWVLNGFDHEDDLWIATDANLHRIYPATFDTVSGNLTLDFNQAAAGWIWAYETNADSTDGQFGYYDTSDINASTSDTNQSYHTDLSIWTGTESTNDFIVPATVTRNNSSGNVALTFNQATSLIFKDLYCRNTGCLENQQPWGGVNQSFGYNANTPASVVTINANDSWYSSNYTEFTENSTSPPANIVGGSANLGVNLPVVTTTISGYVSRSIDTADTFTQYDQLATQEIEWYGRLGSQDITTSDKLYFYPRPADVVWESDWGDGETDIIDDYSQVYVLLAPTKISTYSEGKFTIATDADQPAVVAQELVGKYLHVVDATDDTTYRLKITDNSAGGAGTNLDILVDVDDLTFTPTTDDYIQIVHKRPEGQYYYSMMTRASNFSYTLWYEGQNSIDIEKERSVTPYTNVTHFDLPEAIDNQNNRELKDWFLALPLSLNIHNKSMADIDRLGTKALQSLASDVGLIYSGLDDNQIRKLLYIWMSDVIAYGGCLDGVNNIIQAIMGSDTDISASIVAASNSTGKILQIDLGDGLYSWDYATGNLPKYSTTEELYYMPVAVTDIDFDAREVIHHSLIHIKDRYVGTPIPIFNHSYDATLNKIAIWSDSRLVEQYEVGNSKLIVLQKTEADKLYCLLRNIKRYIPKWTTIQYV